MATEGTTLRSHESYFTFGVKAAVSHVYSWLLYLVEGHFKKNLRGQIENMVSISLLSVALSNIY